MKARFTIILEFHDCITECDRMRTRDVWGTPTQARRIAKRMLANCNAESLIPEVVRVEDCDERVIVAYDWNAQHERPELRT